MLAKAAHQATPASTDTALSRASPLPHLDFRLLIERSPTAKSGSPSPHSADCPRSSDRYTPDTPAYCVACRGIAPPAWSLNTRKYARLFTSSPSLTSTLKLMGSTGDRQWTPSARSSVNPSPPFHTPVLARDRQHVTPSTMGSSKASTTMRSFGPDKLEHRRHLATFYDDASSGIANSNPNNPFAMRIRYSFRPESGYRDEQCSGSAI